MSIYFPFLAFDFAKFFSCHPYSESAKDAPKSYPSTRASCLVSTNTLAIYMKYNFTYSETELAYGKPLIRYQTTKMVNTLFHQD